MNYTVTHVTRFEYLGPVNDSVMEVRLGPRNDGGQEVPWFDIKTTPAATIFKYTDALGNEVHHFDIAFQHRELVVETRMRVWTSAARALPERLSPSAWDTLERLRADGQLWDFFEPSPRVPVSAAVQAFCDASGLKRASDPLTSIREMVAAVHQRLLYAPESTTVDTPVDEVLTAQRGVCQDFAHVTLAVARASGIPCRYVSGYLAPSSREGGERNLTSHAWIEAWLPDLEWVALDPTHDAVAGEHYIAVAVGRDYGDAAPTRGVFRGGPAGTLSVSVRIEEGSGHTSMGEMSFPPPMVTSAPPRPRESSDQ